MLARALPAGELVDPYGGEADIRAAADRHSAPEVVRGGSASDAAGRPVRRALRISTNRPPRSTAMTAAAALATTVSAERVGDELTKLLTQARRPSIGLEILRVRPASWPKSWPELLEGVGVEQNEWHAYDVWHHAMATLDATPPGDLDAAARGAFSRRRQAADERRARISTGTRSSARSWRVDMLARLRFPNEVVEKDRAAGSLSTCFRPIPR